MASPLRKLGRIEEDAGALDANMQEQFSSIGPSQDPESESEEDYQEEITAKETNIDYLKELGERLAKASNKAKSNDIEYKLAKLDDQWNQRLDLRHARVKKLEDILQAVQMLEHDTNELRQWLSTVERELNTPITYSNCNLLEIETKLKVQQELQKDIEHHSSSVSSVLGLCEMLLHDKDACSTDADSEALRITEQSLVHMWNSICKLSFERKTRIEETWRLRQKFLEDYISFEDWLTKSEETLSQPKTVAPFVVIKEEVKKFEESPMETENLSEPEDKTDVDMKMTITEAPLTSPMRRERIWKDMMKKHLLQSTSIDSDGGDELHSRVSNETTSRSNMDENKRLLRSTSIDSDEGDSFHSCRSHISTSSSDMDEVEAAGIDRGGDNSPVRAQGSCVCGHSLFDSLQDEKQHQVALQCQKCRGAWVIQPTGGQPANKENHIRANWIKYYYNPPISDMTQKRKPVRDAVDLERGDHIMLNRGGLYYHHAIVLRVFETSVEIIHWTTNGNAVEIDKGVQDINGSANTYNVVYEQQDLAELVIARALFLMRYAREKYDLVQNNCESFAVFCKTGNSFSFQGKAMEGACPFFMNVATKVASFLDGQS